MNEEFDRENNARPAENQGQPEGSYAYSYRPPQPAPEPRKKKGTWGRILALVLCCVILGGAAGVGGALLVRGGEARINSETAEDKSAGEDLPQPTDVPENGDAAANSGDTVLMGSRPSSVLTTSRIDTDRLMTAAEVYAANVGSTVGITVEGAANYWGYVTPFAASGSGFIISESGYIVTNYHVINGSRSVKVTTFNGETYDAQIIGGDESNDIAVLKIEAEGLVPVVLGDSDNMNVGDTVIAIGNPLGELTFSLSQGVISALNREITLSGSQRMKLIQTDAAINSGNSGGPLFNLYGEVIGITNAKYSAASSSEASIDNIGFAIPVNNVLKIIESIIEKGVIAKPYIGVTVQTVSDEASIYAAAGARVVTVTEGSPAQEAGLRENDIITAVDGKAISSSSELVTIVSSMEPGDEMVLTVYRDRESIELKITVGEQVTSAEVKVPEVQEQESGSGYGYGYGNGGNGFPFGFFGGGIG